LGDLNILNAFYSCAFHPEDGYTSGRNMSVFAFNKIMFMKKGVFVGTVSKFGTIP